jgi:hypothetical protein
MKAFLDPAFARRGSGCYRGSVKLRLPATQYPGNYLGSVLSGLASFPINRIAELTPSAWAARI